MSSLCPLFLAATPCSESVRTVCHVFPLPTCIALQIAYVADGVRTHAEGANLQVTDLGSTNGTYVGDDELATNQAVDVPVGTTIVFGKTLTRDVMYILGCAHAANAKARPTKLRMFRAQVMQAWQPLS